MTRKEVNIKDLITGNDYVYYETDFGCSMYVLLKIDSKSILGKQYSFECSIIKDLGSDPTIDLSVADNPHKNLTLNYNEDYSHYFKGSFYEQIEDYVGDRYIFDLRDYRTKIISFEKLSFLAPEMYREIKLNMDEDKGCLVVERYYEVFYGDAMTVKISSGDKSCLWNDFNHTCKKYIDTMITPYLKDTEQESQGCILTEEVWLIPYMSYEIKHEELVEIFGEWTE